LEHLRPHSPIHSNKTQMHIKNLKLSILLFVIVVSPIIALGIDAPDDLDQQFQAPPTQARPWVFWMWLHADATHAVITRDLEQMKAKGIAGFILYDAGTDSAGPAVKGYQYRTVLVGKEFQYIQGADLENAYITPLPTRPLATWTPQWRELVRFVASESSRLGLKFCLTIGRSAVSGPIPAEYGEQKLVWTETSVQGPQTYDGTLPEPHYTMPKGNFPHPGPRFYHRDVAVLAVPDRDGFSADEVINLTAQMDDTGHLRWEVPAGSWKIIRFVQASTGTHNDWGYFTDGMSAEALDKTWAVTAGPLLKEMSPEERKGIIGLEEDSWEGGSNTWTRAFSEEFKQRRGYDLTPWLPVLAGAKMADDVTCQRIQRDYNLTISDLMADNNYGHLEKLCKENGPIFYSEAAGPNLYQADMLKDISRVDVAMAEFWYPSAHRRAPRDRFWARNAACATHVYGMPVNMDESFTSMGPEWEETPFTMKPVADQAFCDGVNRICFHNFSQSPSLTAKPGYVYLPGTHYEPGITWWDETPAFNLYLARCSFLLQQGKFVADAIFYRGDNIGKGEPMKTIPLTLGEGYDHDNCNSEVLLTRMSVRDGLIVLPDGMSYRVLALPDPPQPMPLADLEKVADLVEAGATMVGPPPTGMSGMPLHPGDGEKFNALAAQLWGGMDGTNVTQKQVGAGRLFWGQTVRQVLQEEDTPPDFEETGLSDAGTMDWIHREADGVEIYFVTSRWGHPENVDCTFRVSGKQPELWDPVTGEIRDATAFRQQNGRTSVPLEFNPCGSVFVIFRKPIPPNLSGTTASNYPAAQWLTTLSGPWTVHFDPKWGGPAKVTFDELVDWTNRPEAGIKYYSGTAVYHKKFNLEALPAQGQRLVLDLGDVDDVATVRLNGHNLGVLWTKPARVDITGIVKKKNNNLEVTVVNLWPNRLIYDETLPEAQRLTETNIHKYGPASPLFPSGLIGPVNLLTESSP
jgi:hypothetical protein